MKNQICTKLLLEYFIFFNISAKLVADVSEN